MKPLLVILAGPNGAGKSTLCKTTTFKAMLEENNTIVINPDDLATQAPNDTNALIWSAREVHRLVYSQIASGRSFLVETTLSGQNHFKTVEAARDAGFHVALHFIFVSNVEVSKKRVALRIMAGGHAVPIRDQERRFGKSMTNLAKMLPLADEAFIYCNDFDIGHELVAEYANGKCEWCDPNVPIWQVKHLNILS
jgi:predicted ABC-type ATPase